MHSVWDERKCSSCLALCVSRIPGRHCRFSVRVCACVRVCAYVCVRDGLRTQRFLSHVLENLWLMLGKGYEIHGLGVRRGILPESLRSIVC